MCNCGQTVDDETYMRNLSNTIAMYKETEKAKTLDELLSEGKAKFKDFPQDMPKEKKWWPL